MVQPGPDSVVAGMTSPKRRAGPHRRRAVAAPIAVVTRDALQEIFLRVPGKDLCRLRAVCHPWRTILSDPLFAAAHAARHPEPLVVAGYNENTTKGVVFDIVDLSGHVVRRVKGATAAAFEWVMSVHLDLICVAEGASGPCRVFNPGRGGASWTLPEGLAPEHASAAHDVCFSHRRTSIVIGQVASMGEFKVLRLFDGRNVQVYDVVTLAAGGRTSRWRGKEAPPYTVSLGPLSSVAVNGFVYFFSNETDHQGQDDPAFHIGSFHLETEEWRPKITGPLRRVMDDGYMSYRESKLAVLSGCLVVVHPTGPYLNLWFLEDCEKGIWVMRKRICTSSTEARPLWVLNDGRIVLFDSKGRKGSLKIHNPETDTSTDVLETGSCTAIGVYTGNLLSLANGSRS